MAEQYDQNDSPICTICLGGFKNPRTLPCTHSFCELCISEHIVSTVTQPGQNTFNCPVCRFAIEAADPKEDKSKWVLSLPLRSVYETEETKQPNCHPCERLEQKVIALKWCCDFNEALCKTCSDVHGRLKITVKHKTVLIENTENPVTLLEAAIDICAIHGDRRIEMYCSDHSSALCNQCLFDNHRQCDSVHLIDGNGGCTEENFNNLKFQLNKLQNTVKTLIEGKNENKTELTSSFSAVEAEALQIVTRLKMKLDDLYVEFLKKAGVKQDAVQNKLDHTLKELNEYSALLGDLMQLRMETVRLYGSKVQMFLVAKDMEFKISNTVQNLEKLFEKDEHIQIKSTFGGVLQTFENLKDLGELQESVTHNKSRLTKTMCDLGLDFLLTVAEPEFSNIDINFNSVLDFTNSAIISCAHLDNNICAVLYSSSLSLVHTPSNDIIESIPISCSPKKLCFDSTRKTLHCTCNSNGGFQCKLDENKLKTPEYCTFDSMVCGIDVCDDKIYTITGNAILQSENFDKQLVWMSSDISGIGDDISIDKVSKRFSVLVKGKRLRFGSIKDKSLQKETFCREFDKAVAIAFGPSGILFVAEKPSSIHVISHDEKSVKTLLTKLQKVRNIKDITVTNDNKKLYVCGDGGLEIYDIVSL